MRPDVSIALLFPDLLGTYGDSGNAVILARRLAWRGIRTELITVRSGDPVPTGCQIYVVGGGEDLPQALASRDLGPAAGRPLQHAVDGGAAVLAVCAGLQILGSSFLGPDGAETAGLGILDCRTVRGGGKRAVGEIVVEAPTDLDLPEMTGYENHAGVTLLGPDAAHLGRVTVGVGNGDGSGSDGARAGKVLGTYMHGPVLARNPALADLLLTWAVGKLLPLDDRESEELRLERLRVARRRPASRAGRLTRLVRP
jgi:lipid II isoglutaminyl synthase (glutamine-hydrolysing)